MPKISIKEAVTRSGFSDATVRRYIRDGRLRAYRLGERLLRVDTDELDTLLKPVTAATGRRPRLTSDELDQQIRAHVATLVAYAPPLTDQQQARLAVLFGGNREAITDATDALEAGNAA